MSVPGLLPRVVLFLGPMELALVGLVVLVLVFGSRAPEIAGKVGESVSKAQEPKRKVEREIEELKGTPEELKEDMGLDEDLEELQEGVEDVQEGLDPDGTSGPDRADDNV